MQGASKVLLVLIVVVVVFLATSACADEQDDGPASAEREKAQFFQHRSVDSAQDDRQSEQGFRNRRIEALRHVIEQRRSQLQDRKRGEGSVSGVRATSSSSSTQRTTTAMASTTASTTTTSEAAMKTMAPFQTPLPLDLKALAMSTGGLSCASDWNASPMDS
ncbi:hypothetical protein PTSG_10828 [Salpingoeca rosetta]|uniref:Uncharacterized protein n=1 Tax=Salpingoeca rosetta (strain ATCC 50818 / BSB-021) TaxID=946362 RepID=F2URH2_SALR5|nr:uncharacterized protein PTSG_10828 [Salpingoeca rosetta]EGD80141.1 hypothetical protein PTSG_10828 [Salpingoeca rosetta]|eukprot:XP_004988203.1 hypothetical protein PTSG_10828 [Salpingoeca rosetta]